jgi:hypothetical protein
MATVFTTVGKAAAADRLDGTTSVFMEYGAWGTGATGALVGDTVIESEAAEARISLTSPGVRSQPSANVNQAYWEMTCAGAGKTIANAGVLTLITGGVLIIHGDFTGVVLAVGDKIAFTATLTQN